MIVIRYNAETDFMNVIKQVAVPNGIRPRLAINVSEDKGQPQIFSAYVKAGFAAINGNELHVIDIKIGTIPAKSPLSTIRALTSMADAKYKVLFKTFKELGIEPLPGFYDFATN